MTMNLECKWSLYEVLRSHCQLFHTNLNCISYQLYMKYIWNYLVICMNFIWISYEVCMKLTFVFLYRLLVKFTWSSYNIDIKFRWIWYEIHMKRYEHTNFYFLCTSYEMSLQVHRTKVISPHMATSNGSWRQGIKGEMTCTVYVALV